MYTAAIPHWAITGPHRRSGDAEPEQVDEHEVERDVDAESGDRHDQRRAGVLQPTQQPRCREDEKHGGEPGHRDRQVEGCLGGDLRVGAERCDEERCDQSPDGGQDDPEPECEPESIDSDGDGTRFIAGTEAAGDGRGRGVGQKHHETDDRLQHGTGQPEPGERSHTEVADHRRIGQQEQGLSDQGAEGRNRESQDVAVNGSHASEPIRGDTNAPDTRGFEWWGVPVTSGSMIGKLHSVVLDCPDPRGLASFYEELLGMERILDHEDWVTLALPDGGPRVAFQLVDPYTPPQWPGQLVPQQLHLDVQVDDLDAAEKQILDLGATDADYREDDFRVYLDPAGHPFCLVLVD